MTRPPHLSVTGLSSLDNRGESYNSEAFGEWPLIYISIKRERENEGFSVIDVRTTTVRFKVQRKGEHETGRLLSSVTSLRGG